MKAAPTLDGRVRIDPESEIDLVVLRAVIGDAQRSGEGLASHLAGGMDSAVFEDWTEFVTPELKDQFDRQLVLVAEDLAAMRPGQPLFIGKDRVESWYGALNQARLALQDTYSFDGESIESMSPEKASARIRYHFYGMIQELLLEILF